MNEFSEEIFKYLPIEQGSEKLYINHLWQSFKILNENNDLTKSFSIIPFHILFILSIQYTVYRISIFKPQEYLNILNNLKLYRKEDGPILVNNANLLNIDGSINRDSSVLNLSKIKERDLFKLLNIINIPEDIILNANVLIENRSSYAHANGDIENDVDLGIKNYLNILYKVNCNMYEINNLYQDWINEIDKDEYPLDQFFEERFLTSHYSKSNFIDLVKNFIISTKITDIQARWIIYKSIDFDIDRTIEILNDIVKFNLLLKNQNRLNVCLDVLKKQA